MKRSLCVRQRRAVLLVFAGALCCAGIGVKLSQVSYQTEHFVNSSPGNQVSLAGVNINTASAAELEKLPGVGPALAARIVEHRARYGRFRRVEHLLIIRGMSDARFRHLRQLITAE
jgi:competence protein ComEA